MGRYDLSRQGIGIPLERALVIEAQVADVILERFAPADQFVALGPELEQLVGQIGVFAALYRGQLPLQVGLPLPGGVQRSGGLEYGGPVIVGEIHRLRHLFGGGGQAVALADQVVPLLDEGLYGGAEVFLTVLERFFHLIEAGISHAPGDGQLSAALGELALPLVELTLHLGELFVQVLQDRGVQYVDAALFDGHVELLLDDAGGRRGGDAVERFEGGHQFVVHIVGQPEQIHIVPRDGQDRHRQHVGVQLHRHGTAYVVVERPFELIEPRGDLDERSVHVRAVVELHDDHRNVVPGPGGDLLDVRQRGEGRLHGPGDLVFGLLRRRARVGGIYHHIGQVHAGQQVRGHVLEGDIAQHQREYDAHDDRIGFFDRDFGQHIMTSVSEEGSARWGGS